MLTLSRFHLVVFLCICDLAYKWKERTQSEVILKMSFAPFDPRLVPPFSSITPICICF